MKCMQLCICRPYNSRIQLLTGIALFPRLVQKAHMQADSSASKPFAWLPLGRLPIAKTYTSEASCYVSSRGLIKDVLACPPSMTVFPGVSNKFPLLIITSLTAICNIAMTTQIMSLMAVLHLGTGLTGVGR